jgi:hypothetical protein
MPGTPYRSTREWLPGVNGFRVYRLGGGSTIWQVRGRLTALNFPSLNALIRRGQSYVDGRIYTFVDNAGQSHRNCLMNDFRPVGPWEACKLASGQAGVTIEVQGTVESVNASQ